LPQAAPADELGFARQPNALGVGEALRFPTELFQENPVFFLELVFNDSLLVSAHPTGDRDEQELELSRHSVENLSKWQPRPTGDLVAVQMNQTTCGDSERFREQLSDPFPLASVT
jgi:hypothetical protein